MTLLLSMDKQMSQCSIWHSILIEEKKKDYFKKILTHLKKRKKEGAVIYPKQSEWFNAIHYTPFEQVKVVIIGQDPYHNPEQAHGLSFSVLPGTKIPPSLRNIYKELHHSCQFIIPDHGCLIPWAKQGVLLLNSVLTVEKNNANSHAKVGWQTFTDTLIRRLNTHPKKIIYLLWGAQAQKKQALIDQKKHAVLTAPHPSPLSAHRGFLGCGHFSAANEILVNAGRSPIHWQL